MEVWTVPSEDAGRCLRDLLRNRMGLSSTALKTAKWNGRILVNGLPARQRDPLRAGDVITVEFPGPVPRYAPRPWDFPLTVPWEDDRLLVVDKPAPLASQSSAGKPDNSLENAVCCHLGSPPDFIYRPVNRLDRGTSGLMVIAKDAHAQDLLQRMLHTPDFLREYLALTEGIPSPPEGVIDLPIGKVDAASVRREVRRDGQRAVTRYRVLQTQGGRALVRLRLETGRTHQIRVHLSALGCPVCGDFLYGQELPDEFPRRFALHSARLRLRHPFTGEWLDLFSPPPWKSGPALSPARWASEEPFPPETPG